jgi:hypothetical protein
MSNNLQPYNPQQMSTSLDAFSEGLTLYLGYLGLPAEAVLVDNGQRRRAINNLPDVVNLLDPGQRQAAMYLSKFAAACATGLFDAALNYLWNETIRNLRRKVIQFDLEYFYDSVVTDPTRRSRLRDENDLDKLEDWELVKGCLTTGIITQIGYRHLDYIRDMRNHASAAHPNQNDLTGLQIVSWLETCIIEVLAKEPEGPAIEVRRLIRSLRQETLTANDVPPIGAAISRLPDDLSRSLLRTTFGMYSDVGLSADIRNNIRLIASEVWNACSDEARYEAGLKHASLMANAEVARARLARQFLELVNGLPYLPPDALALEVSNALDALLTAHGGWNNFANEASHARTLNSLIPPSGEVANNIVHKYVKVLTMCRIGNGYGVSWAGQGVYDMLIGRWQDKHIALFVRLVLDNEVASRLHLTQCARNFQQMAVSLEPQATNAQLKSVLEFINDFPTARAGLIAQDARFKTMIGALRIR